MTAGEKRLPRTLCDRNKADTKTEKKWDLAKDITYNKHVDAAVFDEKRLQWLVECSVLRPFFADIRMGSTDRAFRTAARSIASTSSPVLVSGYPATVPDPTQCATSREWRRIWTTSLQASHRTSVLIATKDSRASTSIPLSRACRSSRETSTIPPNGLSTMST